MMEVRDSTMFIMNNRSKK